MRHSKIACIGLAMALVSCSTLSFSYPGPAESDTEHARLEVHYTDAYPAGSWPSPILLDIHDAGDGCMNRDTLNASYVGTVSLDGFPREIEIASDRLIFFAVRLHHSSSDVDTYCQVGGGFVPAPGHAYSLTLSAYASRRCVLAVHDEGGARVDLSNRGSCRESISRSAPPEPAQ